MDKYVFISNPLPMGDWCTRRFKIDQLDSEQSSGTQFSSVILKTRELMFHIPDILVSPCIETNSVMVVGRKDVYLNPNFISRCSKLNLVDSGSVYPGNSGNILSSCLKYTLTGRLSPLWNSVGKWFFSGKHFLHSKDPINGILLDINIAGNVVEMIISSETFKMNLLQPSELNLSKKKVEEFMSGDENEVLYTEHFGNKRVKVLPNLSSASLVSITKKLPENTQFKDWSEMRRYWKNMYGYRLTEDDSSEPMVYYNVRFRSTGSILTYPEWTVRSDNPSPVRRVDPKPAILLFLQSVAYKLK
ncbi:uncharacterized protein C18orf63 [Eurytemora carolleeae]|uniref:uncharacterized protein C18orf63 n=1 Tax=Eurytemora carolleeae TaxID=1294199 RepID=UPI000C764994|nr:uncharacterized protein C18orf63 [Eurytemora carolleeae]|eukprot:XP_023337779.1 uncharacterized protein C18orf63-like [Eurytemora affinis]